jgi:hypothetical protein
MNVRGTGKGKFVAQFHIDSKPKEPILPIRKTGELAKFITSKVHGSVK